jgi:hypothetical protein
VSDWNQLTWRQRMTNRFPNLTETEIGRLELFREDYKAQRDALIRYRELEIARERAGAGFFVRGNRLYGEMEELSVFVNAIYEWFYDTQSRRCPQVHGATGKHCILAAGHPEGPWFDSVTGYGGHMFEFEEAQGAV